MMEALFYEKIDGDAIRCTLCPHNCKIEDGKAGICKVRVNIKGKLKTLVYNQVAAINSDPIEKKPLYHFYPGTNILSIGQIGCNFSCLFCQNYSISQCSPKNLKNVISLSASDIVNRASTSNTIGIAYTYNEPFTFYEFMLECSKLAHLKNLKNVVVSNGYVNHKPLEMILPFIDAFNIDLKAFNNHFYKNYTKGKIAPILDNLKTIIKVGKHLEITFLVVTGLNDDINEFKEMIKWIASELGSHVPLHISRYFPSYKLTNLATPVSTLENFYDIATKFLNYVYLGNVSDEKRSETNCPKCGRIIIRRNKYAVTISNLINGSVCLNCSFDNRIITESRNL